MSFQTSIYGNAPANTFVYTTTTVSVDNISVENLSATNATISVLTTDLFNPINVDATNIDCTTITVLDDGNFSEIYTHYIHTSNMSLDGTIGGNTGNFVTINADNAAVDALYINEQSVVLTDKSLIKRDGNQVMFIGKNSSTDVTGADFLFRTGEESGAVKLLIPRTSDIVEVIALFATTTIESGTGIFTSANVSDLVVADTTTLGELEVLTSASITNLTVIGPNGLTATKGTITNLSSTKSTLTNASIVNLSISGDFNASGTSRFYNLTAEYFQSYITGVFQDMDAVTGNITTFESNNISNNILIKTINLSAVNTSISNISSTNISATNITGDVSQNLSAGFGIALTTVGGVTTIANTGGSVTDPLNLSTLNASIINVSLLNAPNIEGFTQSTEYAFRSTSDAETVDPIVTIGFTKIPFNEHSAYPQLPWSPFCVPDISAYDKALYEYTVPVSGIWEFGWQIYVQSTTTTQSRLRLIIDGAEAMSAGGYVGNIESAKFVGYVNAGAVVYVKNTNNSITLNLSRSYSFWYGHKLTPANNLITTTTNLSIQNLSVSNDMSALDVKATTGTITTLGSTTGTITTIKSTTINASKLNASNISVDGEIDFGTAITGPLVAVNEIIASQCSLFGLRVNSSASIAILNASTINASNISAINISANDMSALDVKATTGTITTFNSSNINTSNISAINISANEITALDVKSTTGTITTFGSTTGTITTLGSTTINSSNINTSNISAINISATFMTFDTLTPSEKCITAVGEIDAVKFNASVVHISNDLTLDPGGAMRVQSLVSGNDFFIYSNSGNMYLQANGTGNLNIGRNSLPTDISITPAGVITVDNLTSTNAITATNASITNISSTDLTIATSLTGAGSINITGDVSAGIVNATTLTGNIAGNLSAGTGIILSTAAGVTNISNSAPYQLPVSRVFSARTTANQTPNPSGNNYYTNYDQINQASSHVTYVAVPISTGGANTGAIIQTAGTYKITFTQQVYNVSYTNRVSWWSRATKNGTVTGAQTFIYTRSDQSQYGQYGSNSVTWIETCAVNDYLQVWSVVAKNSALYNDNWTGLRGGAGSMLVIELLT